MIVPLWADEEQSSCPTYISELLHVYTPSRILRSSSDTPMLKIEQYKRKTHSFRTLSCFGPHNWNSLPQDLGHCSTQTENNSHSTSAPTPPKGARGCLMSFSCLEPGGCHLIPLSYLPFYFIFLPSPLALSVL